MNQQDMINSKAATQLFHSASTDAWITPAAGNSKYHKRALGSKQAFMNVV